MEVRGTNLKMTRGDSEYIIVSCPKRPFAEGDEIVFTVKQNERKREIELQKRITVFEEGKAFIEIMPQDTSGMEFGSYKYDVQLTTADGVVTTIIKPSVFRLAEEVTWDG